MMLFLGLHAVVVPSMAGWIGAIVRLQDEVIGIYPIDDAGADAPALIHLGNDITIQAPLAISGLPAERTPNGMKTKWN